MWRHLQNSDEVLVGCGDRYSGCGGWYIRSGRQDIAQVLEGLALVIGEVQQIRSMGMQSLNHLLGLGMYLFVQALMGRSNMFWLPFDVVGDAVFWVVQNAGAIASILLHSGGIKHIRGPDWTDVALFMNDEQLAWCCTSTGQSHWQAQ
jgi:hypothetical protein